MSHYKERKEKNCLNCGTQVEGRFCQHCGQENIIARESFWSLLTHFVYDITHFDSKFFGTMKYLLTKPGRLSLEYINGKRNSYLHPIRMYVFTSAFFFIIFFMLFRAEEFGRSDSDHLDEKLENLRLAKSVVEDIPLQSKDSAERQTARKVMADLDRDIAAINDQQQEKESKDSLRRSMKKQVADSLEKNGIKVPKKIRDESLSVNIIQTDSSSPFMVLNYQSVEAYRRMQAALPKDKKNSWIEKAFITKIIAASETGKLKGERAFLSSFLYNLFHSFPKMLFTSLPLFALFLGWLYGRRKDLAYSDHAIFTIHTYCATFIFLLGTFALNSLQEATGWGIIGFVQVVASFAIWLYLYKGMRHFYGESRSKTLVKFFLLNILSFFMMTLLLVIFTALSAAQVGSSH